MERAAHSNSSRAPVQYRLIEHTADLGFEVEAPGLEGLFARAILALHDVIADTAAAEPRVERRIEVEGSDLEDLLVRALEEAHWAFESERLLFSEVTVERVDPGAPGRPARATALARGEPLDPARHEPRRAVKAVTYHGIEVAPGPAGWRAAVILDL